MKDKELTWNRVNSLRNELKKLEEAYYSGKELVRDGVYDFKMRELMALERKFPELLDGHSPSEQIGMVSILPDMKTLPHRHKMLSLKNVFSLEELSKFISDLEGEFFIEPKVDGVSLSLEYSEGKLQSLITRGDGMIGQNITSKSPFIDFIPHTIPFLFDLTVRGEVFLDKSRFEALQQMDSSIRSPRSTVAGSLMLRDPEKCGEVGVKFMAFQALGKQLPFSLQSQSISFLKECGFRVQENTLQSSEESEIVKWIEDFGKNIPNLEIPVDGAVIKVNALNRHSSLGENFKYPKWAIAYKFESEIQKTELLNIEFEVGRTGKMTFLGNLKPVFIGGHSVKKVLLYNPLYISSRDVRIGDMLSIFRSGEVIPKLLEVDMEQRKSCLKVWEPPTKCRCLYEVVKKNDLLFCSNPLCHDRLVSQLTYAVSRDCLDIKGLSRSLMEDFLNLGFIKNLPDLFILRRHESSILSCDEIRVGKKLLHKIFDSIDEARNTSFSNFILSLGIGHIGAITSVLLSKEITSVEELLNSDHQKLTEAGLGDVTSRSVCEWIGMTENATYARRLAGYLNITTANKNDNYMTFCITGSFSQSRAVIIDLLSKKGYLFKNSLKVDFLLVGENPGIKYELAKQYGIKIVDSVEELLKGA